MKWWNDRSLSARYNIILQFQLLQMWFQRIWGGSFSSRLHLDITLLKTTGPPSSGEISFNPAINFQPQYTLPSISDSPDFNLDTRLHFQNTCGRQAPKFLIDCRSAIIWPTASKNGLPTIATVAGSADGQWICTDVGNELQWIAVKHSFTSFTVRSLRYVQATDMYHVPSQMLLLTTSGPTKGSKHLRYFDKTMGA